jgi:hypothetical protein
VAVAEVHVGEGDGARGVSESVSEGVVSASSTTEPACGPLVMVTTSLVPVMVITTSWVVVEPLLSSTVTV